MVAKDAAQVPPRGGKIGVVVIHGVGDTETGWINERIVEPLTGSRSDMILGPYSEVYGFSESDGERKLRFNALIRRAHIAGQDIATAELLWADLSRVGRSAISQAIATIKLAFEAPHVLALALMRGRERGVFRLIKWLVMTSSRLLLWLIVGLNICVLAGTAWMMGAIQLRNGLGWASKSFDHTDIILWLGPLVVILIVTGAVLFVRNHNKELGLAEFGRGLFLSTALIAAFLVLDHLYPQPLLDTLGGLTDGKWKKDAYIDNGRLIIFAVWFLWCVSTLTVFALLVSVWAKRQIRAPADGIPLAPGWIALFHILIQAVIVKLIFAPLSMASCGQMRALAGDTGPYSALGICSAIEMSGVFFLALAETVVIVIAVLLVWRARSRASCQLPLDAAAVPRLIVNRWIVAAAAVSVTAHIAVFFLDMWKGGVYALMLPGPLMVALSFVLPIYLFLLGYFYSSSSGLVHIARDLVDHQLRVEPVKGRHGQTTSAMGALASRWLAWRPRFDLTEFPRRHRIASRLDCIMSTCFAPEGLDKLVIIAHSQGTVIAFDYLRAAGHSELLSKVGEVHVITLGSPLSHLYAAYFQEYERPLARQGLRGNVVSWTNLWRIDDPIGNRVDVVAGDFIRNEALPPGGHVNYWKEPQVQQAILSAIAPPTPSPEPLAPALPVAHRAMMD